MSVCGFFLCVAAAAFILVLVLFIFKYLSMCNVCKRDTCFSFFTIHSSIQFQFFLENTYVCMYSISVANSFFYDFHLLSRVLFLFLFFLAIFNSLCDEFRFFCLNAIQIDIVFFAAVIFVTFSQLLLSPLLLCAIFVFVFSFQQWFWFIVNDVCILLVLSSTVHYL